MRLPETIESILSRLQSAGFSAYAVGGCVRDTLAGREPHDWDVCTAARPEQVHAVFAGEDVRDTGLKHGTVTLVIGHTPYEITTFRVDGSYSDSRRPDSVSFTDNVVLDLSRRDFTINAMAFSPADGLVDPFGGQEDLKNGVLRCVGEPEARFGEDALRILRALRFAARFGFRLDARTAEAVHELAPTLEKIAPERIKTELDGILAGADAASVLRDFPDVIGVPVPEILPCVGFDQRSPWHVYDVWEHTWRAVAAAPEDPLLRWTMLFHDLGKPPAFSSGPDGNGHFFGHAALSAKMADGIMARLRFSNDERTAIAELVRRHDGVIEPDRKILRRLLGRLGRTQFDRLLAVKRADNLAQAPELAEPRLAALDELRALADTIEQDDDCTGLAALAVNGRDLLELGYTPGPALGAELQRLLELVLDDPGKNDRDTLLTIAEDDKTARM
jgi:tRNA nucleotidyltransferase (CCA-adding enzyme)